MKSYTYDFDTGTVPGLEDRKHEVDLLNLGDIDNMIIESLGAAAAYTDRSDTISECLEASERLSGLLYVVEEFVDEVDDGMVERVEPVASSRVTTHRNMLGTHSKILSGLNGDRDWYYMGDQENVRELAESTITHVDPTSIVSRSWVDLLVGSEELDTLLSTTYFMHHLEKMKCSARRISTLVPGKFTDVLQSIHDEAPVFKMTATGTRPLDHDEVLGLLHFNERESWKDSATQDKIAVHSRNLLNLIIELSENPDKIYTEGLHHSNQQRTELLVHGFVDDTIAERHSEYFTPLSGAKKRKKRLSQYAKRQKEIDGLLPSTKPERVEKITVEEPERPDSGSAENENIREIELVFPWIGEDPKPYDVTLIKGDERNVYIVNAQEPKAEEISDKVKKGLSKNEAGLDVFEQEIAQRAKALASGIMPYEDNAVKRLSKTDMRENYKGMSIWYSFDKSPNAPRTYFTVKPAPKKLGDSVKDDDVLLVVLGETDKARQIALLQRFTTFSRSVLKKNGAGSV